MIKLTLCPKGFTGDVPTYEFNVLYDAYLLLTEFLELEGKERTVFVCFQTFSIEECKYFFNEQKSILVSHDANDIDTFFESTIEHADINDCSFSVFAFESYEEAFKYCIDLKEGM